VTRGVRFAGPLLAAAMIGATSVAAGCGSAAPARPAAATAAASRPAAPSPAAPSGGAAPSPSASALQPVTVAIPAKSVSFVDVYVAQETGIAKANGLRLRIEVTKTPVGLDALQTGGVNFWAGAGSGAKAADTGRPVRIVFVSNDQPGQAIVTKSAIQRVSQLKGQRVIVRDPLTTSQLVTRYLLQQAALAPGTYQFLYGGTPAQALAELDKGLAAAANIELDYAYRVQGKGYRILLDSRNMSLLGGGLVASTAEIQNDPSLVRRTVATWRQTVSYMMTHRAAVLSVMEHDFNESPPIAARLYDFIKPGWLPSGRPPTKAVDTEIQLDTAALQGGHVKLSHPLTPSEFMDMSFTGS
jgi:ABC-type nitrate/sulfonate/bicarbonate transport system substrate-binding protein